jgi:hypothetical protein
MAASGPPIAETQTLVRRWREWFSQADGGELGEGLIGLRESGIEALQAAFSDGLRRFDKSGEYAAEGALNVVGWLRSKLRFAGNAAAEQVAVARQLEHLPETRKAFARGELTFQHVAVLARTAEHLGSEAVRQQEQNLVKAAETMDAGQFVGLAKDFEHRVDAEAMLQEANRAHARRYLNISEPSHGMVRVDGILDSEGGAILRRAVEPSAPPAADDDRSPGQRRADRLIELLSRGGLASREGAGPRPYLIVRTSLETLVGEPGAPAGELDDAGPIPAETVRRHACDTALSRIIGRGELEGEITRASRTIPPATRRALAERDRGCVVTSCRRPPHWTDAHHLTHWAHGGPTTMSNLILLCRPHHRMVHEEGWHLQRLAVGRWSLSPPLPRSRSA